MQFFLQKISLLCQSVSIQSCKNFKLYFLFEKCLIFELSYLYITDQLDKFFHVDSFWSFWRLEYVSVRAVRSHRNRTAYLTIFVISPKKWVGSLQSGVNHLNRNEVLDLNFFGTTFWFIPFKILIHYLILRYIKI